MDTNVCGIAALEQSALSTNTVSQFPSCRPCPTFYPGNVPHSNVSSIRTLPNFQNDQSNNVTTSIKHNSVISTPIDSIVVTKNTQTTKELSVDPQNTVESHTVKLEKNYKSAICTSIDPAVLHGKVGSPSKGCIIPSHKSTPEYMLKLNISEKSRKKSETNDKTVQQKSISVGQSSQGRSYNPNISSIMSPVGHSITPVVTNVTPEVPSVTPLITANITHVPLVPSLTTSITTHVPSIPSSATATATFIPALSFPTIPFIPVTPSISPSMPTSTVVPSLLRFPTPVTSTASSITCVTTPTTAAPFSSTIRHMPTSIATSAPTSHITAISTIPLTTSDQCNRLAFPDMCTHTKVGPLFSTPHKTVKYLPCTTPALHDSPMKTHPIQLENFSISFPLKTTFSSTVTSNIDSSSQHCHFSTPSTDFDEVVSSPNLILSFNSQTSGSIPVRTEKGRAYCIDTSVSDDHSEDHSVHQSTAAKSFSDKKTFECPSESLSKTHLSHENMCLPFSVVESENSWLEQFCQVDEIIENLPISPPPGFTSTDPPARAIPPALKLATQVSSDILEYETAGSILSPIPYSSLDSPRSHILEEVEEEPPPICYATMPVSNTASYGMPSFPIFTGQELSSVSASREQIAQTSQSDFPQSIASAHFPFLHSKSSSLSSVAHSPVTHHSNYLSLPSVSSHAVIAALHQPLTMLAHSHVTTPSPLQCTLPAIPCSLSSSRTSSAENILDVTSLRLQKVTSGPTSGNPASTAVSVNASSTTTTSSSAQIPLAAPKNVSVSDKMKFFEKAMEEQHQPSPKPEKVFSFLSQDEVERMKQEEEKKIASLSRSELKTWTQLNEPDEDDEHIDELEHVEEINHDSDHCMESNVHMTPMREPPVRTAKAERRRKERLLQEGALTDEEDKELSPAEQRALRAEKRAAWRQARFKSLEQDALQAQMVIKKMSEMIDGEQGKGASVTSTSTSIMSTIPSEETDSLPLNNNNIEDNHIQNNRVCADGDNNLNIEPCPALLRPSSADFPKLAVRAQEGATKIRESERLLGEKVTRRTEEYVDEASGEIRVRTIEYIEKLIEKEVETTCEKIISLELCSPDHVDDNVKLETSPATATTAAVPEEEEEEDVEDEEQQSSDLPSSTPTSPTSEDAPDSAASNKKRKRKRNKKKH